MSPFDPKLRRTYDADHRVTDADREQLPDTQNGSAHEIKGAPVAVQKVGASHFRLPMRIVRKDGSEERLETSVTGTVQLGEGVRGINMSRILRAFYQFKDDPVDLAALEKILERIRGEVDSAEADLQLAFSYPIEIDSLRSGLKGFQYYDVVYEGFLGPNGYRPRLQLDFVYSSACPGSSDLAEHARTERNVYAIPHSQRSRARISTELKPGSRGTIEDLHELCVQALQTEVQVMVRREDEQAFAELNGAYTKFVEDAARLLFEVLNPVDSIVDFRVVCAHLESLHAHDAVAVVTKGVEGGFRPDFENFRELIC
jgi:GTP cyclohydrolase I